MELHQFITQFVVMCGFCSVWPPFGWLCASRQLAKHQPPLGVWGPGAMALLSRGATWQLFCWSRLCCFQHLRWEARFTQEEGSILWIYKKLFCVFFIHIFFFWYFHFVKCFPLELMVRLALNCGEISARWMDPFSALNLSGKWWCPL